MIIKFLPLYTVEFIEEPRSQSILIGESAIFNCKAYAHLTTWYINGQE